jgi:tRNA (guanine-N(7)-)-methyltransferase
MSRLSTCSRYLGALLPYMSILAAAMVHSCASSHRVIQNKTFLAAALENVRVLNAEGSYAVAYLVPETSVETFYLLFPDPWPKRRHHRRRILKADFLDSIHRALADRGFFHITTDQLDYFQQISRLAQNHSGFAIVDVSASRARTVDLPLTKFERRFRELGPIHRLALQKISPVR